MRVAAAVLTYRALSTGRGRLLRRCWESLQEADAVYLVDNGSGDGTEVLVDWLGGYCHRGTLHTSGHGTNLCARVLAGDGANICVHSDDDMVWRPGWRAKLERWWAEAPADVAGSVGTLTLSCVHLSPGEDSKGFIGAAFRQARKLVVESDTSRCQWYRWARRSAFVVAILRGRCRSLAYQASCSLAKRSRVTHADRSSLP